MPAILAANLVVLIAIGAVAMYAVKAYDQKYTGGTFIPFKIVHADSVTYDDPIAAAKLNSPTDVLTTSADGSFSFYYPSEIIGTVTKQDDGSLEMTTKDAVQSDRSASAQISVSAEVLKGSFEDVIAQRQKQQIGYDAAITEQKVLLQNGLPMYEYSFYTGKSVNRSIYILKGDTVYSFQYGIGNDADGINQAIQDADAVLNMAVSTSAFQ